MRVVIADDSVLLREGVARLLEESGFEVVGQSGNAEDLLRHVGLYKPDVAVVDIRMPPTHTDEGLRAAKAIRERFPDTGVLVLSQYVEPGYAIELLSESAEGIGYLLKDRISDVEQFASAVRRVGEGGSALDPAVVSQLVGRRRADGPLDELTPREREVLGLMAEGRSNQAIAERHVRHAPRRREARDEHLHEAGSAGQHRRPPPRPRGARLLADVVCLARFRNPRERIPEPRQIPEGAAPQPTSKFASCEPLSRSPPDGRERSGPVGARPLQEPAREERLARLSCRRRAGWPEWFGLPHHSRPDSHISQREAEGQD